MYIRSTIVHHIFSSNGHECSSEHMYELKALPWRFPRSFQSCALSPLFSRCRLFPFRARALSTVMATRATAAARTARLLCVRRKRCAAAAVLHVVLALTLCGGGGVDAADIVGLGEHQLLTPSPCALQFQLHSTKTPSSWRRRTVAS